MKRNLIAFFVAVLISNPGINAVFAQKTNLPPHKSDVSEQSEPFVINGKKFANQKEFIESGARCRTRQPSVAQSLNVQEQLERVKASRLIMDAAGVAEFTDEGLRAPGTVTINVRWHVINKGEGIANGDISQAMIDNQIAVLNKAYGGETGGFNTPFRFVLQSVDRTTNADWFAQNNEDDEFKMKSALRTGGAGTLNIYTAGMTDGTLGWAYLPEDVQGFRVYDGVVLLYSSLPGGSAAPYNLGDTATHEVGHWMGLYHTFENGCEKSTGDFVWDTPSEKTESYSCRANHRSCPRNGGYDPTTNFMDYTDDACMFKFTPGQAQRMDLSLEIYRGL